MKILVVGDIHCKPQILSFAEECTEWDKMVFLGDACDNWGATQGDNVATVEQIIKLKERCGDKFVWLLGNHDWGYFDESISMSGHIRLHSSWVRRLLEEYINMWQICYVTGNYWFSHAGISKKFLDKYLDGDIYKLNALKQTGLSNPLNNVGKSCGGSSNDPSPLWARPEELDENSEWPVVVNNRAITQVVGHTPSGEITRFGKNLVVCDTWSQYPNLQPCGDQTFLIIDTKEKTLNAINQKGEVLYGVT